MPPPRQFLVRKPVVDEFQTIETSDLSRTRVVIGPGVSVPDHIAVFPGTDGQELADGGMTIAEVIAAAGGFPDLTYLTDDDETADLPNSRRLLAGVNVAFDDTVPGVRTVNVASTSTVVTDPSGALAGDGSPGDPLAVLVDGVTVGINASNELEVLAAPATVDVDPSGPIIGDGSPSSPLGIAVDGVTVAVNGSGELESLIPNSGVTPGSYTNLNATIGADGRITSAANGTSGGGGGWTLLATLTASASASLTLTGVFTSTYDEYILEFINLLPTNANVFAWLRMSTNAGVSYDAGANYSYDQWVFRFAGGVVRGGAGQNQIILSENSDGLGNLATTGGLRGFLRVFNPLSATAHKQVEGQFRAFCSQFANAYVMTMVGGSYNSATAVDALQIAPSDIGTGGTWASGIVRCYGVQK